MLAKRTRITEEPKYLQDPTAIPVGTVLTAKNAVARHMVALAKAKPLWQITLYSGAVTHATVKLVYPHCLHML